MSHTDWGLLQSPPDLPRFGVENLMYDGLYLSTLDGAGLRSGFLVSLQNRDPRAVVLSRDPQARVWRLEVLDDGVSNPDIHAPTAVLCWTRWVGALKVPSALLSYTAR